jgi:hypothetical protein
MNSATIAEHFILCYIGVYYCLKLWMAFLGNSWFSISDTDHPNCEVFTLHSIEITSTDITIELLKGL